jgi:DNA-binding transcriptional LysR family regulator
MDLEETRAFLAVLDHGSFKAAAEFIRQPRATLRRRVEALEARVGVPLLERSRSGVVPTPAGLLLGRQARVMVRESNCLLVALRELGDEPTDELRIGVPCGLSSRGLALVLGLFQAQFPHLRVHLQVSDEPIEQLAEQVDLALSFRHEQPPGSWQVHTLGRVHEGLRASRSYLRRYGVPQTIEDLARHKLLGWQAPGRDGECWPSYGGGSFAIEPVMTTNDQDLLRRFASLGFGIALLCNSDLHDDDDDGDDDEALLPVLEGFVGRTRELRMHVPEILGETAKIRAIVEHLERFVKQAYGRGEVSALDFEPIRVHAM